MDDSGEPDKNDLSRLIPEEDREKLKWQLELSRLESEIETLRHVLSSKTKDAQDLRRRLGISAWQELTDDVTQGIRSVEDKLEQLSRPLCQKTEQVFRKTSSLFGGLSTRLKTSESIRVLEEKVGAAYESVRTKVGASKAETERPFSEIFGEVEETTEHEGVPPLGL